MRQTANTQQMQELKLSERDASPEMTQRTLDGAASSHKFKLTDRPIIVENLEDQTDNLN